MFTRAGDASLLDLQRRWADQGLPGDKCYLVFGNETSGLPAAASVWAAERGAAAVALPMERQEVDAMRPAPGCSGVHSPRGSAD